MISRICLHLPQNTKDGFQSIVSFGHRAIGRNLNSNRDRAKPREFDPGRNSLEGKFGDASNHRPDWKPATVGQKLAVHDWLRTGEDSRAAVRLSDSSILRLDEFTENEILPPKVAGPNQPSILSKAPTTFLAGSERGS
jgi:hypothetical protein